MKLNYRQQPGTKSSYGEDSWRLSPEITFLFYTNHDDILTRKGMKMIIQDYPTIIFKPPPLAHETVSDYFPYEVIQFLSCWHRSTKGKTPSKVRSKRHGTDLYTAIKNRLLWLAGKHILSRKLYRKRVSLLKK